MYNLQIITNGSSLSINPTSTLLPQWKPSEETKTDATVNETLDIRFVNSPSEAKAFAESANRLFYRARRGDLVALRGQRDASSTERQSDILDGSAFLDTHLPAMHTVRLVLTRQNFWQETSETATGVNGYSLHFFGENDAGSRIVGAPSGDLPSLAKLTFESAGSFNLNHVRFAVAKSSGWPHGWLDAESAGYKHASATTAGDSACRNGNKLVLNWTATTLQYMAGFTLNGSVQDALVGQSAAVYAQIKNVTIGTLGRIRTAAGDGQWTALQPGLVYLRDVVMPGRKYAAAGSSALGLDFDIINTASGSKTIEFDFLLVAPNGSGVARSYHMAELDNAMLVEDDPYAGTLVRKKNSGYDGMIYVQGGPLLLHPGETNTLIVCGTNSANPNNRSVFINTTMTYRARWLNL